MGQQSRAKAARKTSRLPQKTKPSGGDEVTGPLIIIPGSTRPTTGPTVGKGRGGKEAVVGTTRAPLVCKFWRGGRMAREELRRLGFTQVSDPKGLGLPGENTLAKDCGLGGEFFPTLTMLGICDYGDPDAPRATLACHAAQAAGFTTTPCKHQKPVVRDAFDLTEALEDAKRIPAVMAEQEMENRRRALAGRKLTFTPPRAPK